MSTLFFFNFLGNRVHLLITFCRLKYERKARTWQQPTQTRPRQKKTAKQHIERQTHVDFT